MLTDLQSNIGDCEYLPCLYIDILVDQTPLLVVVFLGFAVTVSPVCPNISISSGAAHCWETDRVYN